MAKHFFDIFGKSKDKPKSEPKPKPQAEQEPKPQAEQEPKPQADKLALYKYTKTQYFDSTKYTKTQCFDSTSQEDTYHVPDYYKVARQGYQAEEFLTTKEVSDYSSATSRDDVRVPVEAFQLAKMLHEKLGIEFAVAEVNFPDGYSIKGNQGTQMMQLSSFLMAHGVLASLKSFEITFSKEDGNKLLANVALEAPAPSQQSYSSKFDRFDPNKSTGWKR